MSLKAGAEEPMKVQFRNRSETQTIYNLKVTASTDTKAVSRCAIRGIFPVSRLRDGCN
ncbi:MAG: hypothetical protein ACLSCO_17790 [Gallintestinimicrobium sp.]